MKPRFLYIQRFSAEARVQTLDGEVDVRVPGGTQHGEEMVFKGRGVKPVYGGENGDLFVAFNVLLPRSLTKRQRELLQLYADDVEGKASTSSAPSKDQQTPPSSSSRKTVDKETEVTSHEETANSDDSQDEGEQQAKRRATG